MVYKAIALYFFLFLFYKAFWHYLKEKYCAQDFFIPLYFQARTGYLTSQEKGEERQCRHQPKDQGHQSGQEQEEKVQTQDTEGFRQSFIARFWFLKQVFCLGILTTLMLDISANIFTTFNVGAFFVVVGFKVYLLNLKTRVIDLLMLSITLKREAGTIAVFFKPSEPGLFLLNLRSLFIFQT